MYINSVDLKYWASGYYYSDKILYGGDLTDMVIMDDRTPNEILGSMSLDIQEKMKTMMQDPIAYQFKMCYHKACAVQTRNKLQHGIVKECVVRKLLKPITSACNNKLINSGINPLDNTIFSLVFNEERLVGAVYQYLLFTIGDLSDEERFKLQNDDNYINEVVDEISTYLCDFGMGVGLPTPTEPNSPEIWAFTIFCDKMNMNHSYFGRDLEGAEKIFMKLMQYALSTIKAITGLVADGQFNSAITLWRHLHEQECILEILQRNGDSAIESYWKHAFEWGELDNDDMKLKAEIKKYANIKTDAKKIVTVSSYKNYGWLLKIPEFVLNCEKEKY